MRNNKFIKTILIVIALCTVSYLTITAIRNLKKTHKNPTQFIQTSPKEFQDIFNSWARRKMLFKAGVSFKLRNKIAYYQYDEKYDLEISEIDIKNNFNLTQDLVINNLKVNGDFPESAMPYSESLFTTNYNGVANQKALKIYLLTDADSEKVITNNETLACFSFKLKKLNILYNDEREYAFTASTNSQIPFFDNSVPICTIFLKKQEHLYFLFFSPVDKGIPIDPNALLSIIDKK